jgi:hypothetical protein
MRVDWGLGWGGWALMPPSRGGKFHSKSWFIKNVFVMEMCLSERMCKVDLFAPQGRSSCSVRCHYCVRRISAGHRVYNKLVFEYSGNMYCCSMLRGPEEFLKSLPVNPWNFYSPSRHMTTSSMPIRPYTLCRGSCSHNSFLRSQNDSIP